MSLSDKKVQSLLTENFVLGWSNISGVKDYAGKSGRYECKDSAVYTTNGAGSSNIQFLIVDPQKRVVNCLPGFWSPEALKLELKLALELVALGKLNLKPNERDDRFMLAHLNHAVKIGEIVHKDSQLQGFDAREEKKKPESSFRRPNSEQLKTVDQVIHEKMAELPFLKLEDFDIGKFVSYGTKFYDKKTREKRNKRSPTPPNPVKD